MSETIVKEKLRLLEEKPIFCRYDRTFEVWVVHLPNGVVIIHDAKHYLEAVQLEEFYKNNFKKGRLKAYRLNTDIVQEEQIAKRLLMSCPNAKRISRAYVARSRADSP